MTISETLLLTEAEAATMLGCNRQKIKRMRLGGKLPFIPGRPVTIMKRDLEDYITAEARKKTEPRWAWGQNLSPEQIRRIEAHRWALEAVLKPPRAKRVL